MSVTIKNFKMPDRCRHCIFKEKEKINDYGYFCECHLDKKERKINLYDSGRPDWCPLEEI